MKLTAGQAVNLTFGDFTFDAEVVGDTDTEKDSDVRVRVTSEPENRIRSGEEIALPLSGVIFRSVEGVNVASEEEEEETAAPKRRKR